MQHALAVTREAEVLITRQGANAHHLVAEPRQFQTLVRPAEDVQVEPAALRRAAALKGQGAEGAGGRAVD